MEWKLVQAFLTASLSKNGVVRSLMMVQKITECQSNETTYAEGNFKSGLYQLTHRAKTGCFICDMRFWGILSGYKIAKGSFPLPSQLSPNKLPNNKKTKTLEGGEKSPWMLDKRPKMATRPYNSRPSDWADIGAQQHSPIRPGHLHQQATARRSWTTAPRWHLFQSKLVRHFWAFFFR
jgi:hypothetical protein